jgi:hypothetical protein
MPPIVVNVDQWPVVQAVWDGEQSDDDIDAYIRDTLDCYKRREPFITITWMKKYSATTEHRRRIADMMKHTEGDVKTFSVCSAIIAPSAGFRFVLSTVLLLKPMATPYKVCSSFAEALPFVREHARLRKMTLPSQLKPMVVDG